MAAGFERSVGLMRFVPRTRGSGAFYVCLRIENVVDVKGGGWL